MIIKKPYAFFIKYFRLINFILVVLFGYLIYKLTSIGNVFNQMVSGNIINYSSLNSTYIGLESFLVVVFILILLTFIILLLKVKKKPFKDYLFGVLYILFLFFYLLHINSIFISLESTLLEQTTIDFYGDISFVLSIPGIYFFVKYFLISIGFNLKKFNFTNDIIELKQEENDNEEIEVIFNKNTYKYKRRVRKTFRELKYYYLENRLFILIITGVILFVSLISLISPSIFKTNNVKVGESFVASNINYVVEEVIETSKDANNKLIKKGSKFILVSIRAKNAINVSQNIDLKRIRLFYGKDFEYANLYYNKYFLDIGNVYNNEMIFGHDYKTYNIIFEVPSTYKSHKYVLKFYDKVIYEDEEVKGSYKEVKVKSKNIDAKQYKTNVNLKDKVILDKNRYGDSSLTINKYSIQNNYLHKENEDIKIFKPKDINDKLLVLDYNLSLNKDTNLKDFTVEDFFNKFYTIEYNFNDNTRVIKPNILTILDNKLIVVVPYDISYATNINLILSLRTKKIIYKLK